MTFSNMFRLTPVVIGLGLAAAGSVASAEDPSTQSGAYIATASDCAACHTAAGGKPFAGGYAISSPMGAIISSNITPSKEYGIGTWTLEDFSRAVRDGVSKDGTHLYPAMPYPAYAKMTDKDIAALYDYFMHQVAPVEAAAPETQLPFPFSQRWAMIGWNALFAGGAPLTPDAGQSADWNRGKYLVEGPAHCGTCHTPRNVLMGSDNSRNLAGGAVGAWYAPNLTAGKGGVGDWSDADLSAYLKTGIGEHARASGPMAEAVEHSFQHLTDSDIAAMVTYLRSLPAIDDPKARAPVPAKASPVDFVPADLAPNRTRHGLSADATGAELYTSVCASCHGVDGAGSANGFYPKLAGNLTFAPGQEGNLISTILNGVTREVDGKRTLMPGFGPGSLVQVLTDEQIATLASYTATQFGGQPVSITAADVATARTGGPVAPLVQLASPRVMILAALVAVVIVLLAIVLFFRLRRSRAQ